MIRVAPTCPSNHWLNEDFFRLVDCREEQEVRERGAAKPYETPVREQVIGAILTYAIPAGNA